MTIIDTFQTLYKKTSTGAVQTWKIWVEDAEVVTEHGQLDGKHQVDRVLATPKNVGRSNATTAEQQAILDARYKWEHKAKSGYVTTAAAALAGETHELIEGGVLPMLAHKFSEQSAKIRYPAAVQGKLDGHRCLAITNDDGTVTLWSRTRKEITGVPHVARAVEGLELAPGTVLDGELYNHDYRDRFEALTHFIRQQTPTAGHEIVHYHVYDIAGPGTFGERSTRLSDLLLLQVDPLVNVLTRVVTDEADLMEAFSDFVADGYEGAIVRNLSSPYVNKRSYDLQKLKSTEDEEWRVVCVEEGKGRMAGRAIFVCDSPAGRFNVKMAGALDSLNKYFEDPSLAVGKLLTVRFQSLTAAGIPRFPIGVRFREDA